MRPPDWPSYYIGLAHVIARKSHDTQTQHGCVITDRKNIVLGLGYNGLPRGVDDKNFPTTRPAKYPWMIHAERNALANCVVRPDDGIAYVTGQCCNDCIMALWQGGVTEVYMDDRHGSHLIDENAMKIFHKFVEETKMSVHFIQTDLQWLFSVIDNVRST